MMIQGFRAEFDMEDFPAGDGYMVKVADVYAQGPVTSVCIEYPDGKRIEARKVTPLCPDECYFDPGPLSRSKDYSREQVAPETEDA